MKFMRVFFLNLLKKCKVARALTKTEFLFSAHFPSTQEKITASLNKLRKLLKFG